MPVLNRAALLAIARIFVPSRHVIQIYLDHMTNLPRRKLISRSMVSTRAGLHDLHELLIYTWFVLTALLSLVALAVNAHTQESWWLGAVFTVLLALAAVAWTAFLFHGVIEKIHCKTKHRDIDFVITAAPLPFTLSVSIFFVLQRFVLFA